MLHYTKALQYDIATHIQRPTEHDYQAISSICFVCHFRIPMAHFLPT